MARAHGQLALGAARLVLGGLVTLGFWTLWLVLGLLLAVQLRVASTHQLQVPDFVQRALLERLAVSGIRVTFGHTLFDPSGRIVVEDAQVALEGFDEPVATARAIYVRVDPWALAIGRFEPVELRATGVSLRVPAMLSPSGRADEFVRDLDAEVIPRGNALRIDYLRCHLGTLAVSVDGDVLLEGGPGGRGAPLPMAQALARNYAGLSRQCAVAIGALRELDTPFLRIRLKGTPSGGTVVRAFLTASALRLSTAPGVRMTGIRAEARGPLPGGPGGPVEVALEADTVELPGLGASARGARILLHGALPLSLSGVDFSAAGATVAGVEAGAPIVDIRGSGADLLGALRPPGAGTVRAGLKTLLWGGRLCADGNVDPLKRTADLRFDVSLAPASVGALGVLLKRDLSPFVSLTTPVSMEGRAKFGSGWKFAQASARVDAGSFVVRQVRIDEARGTVDFDGSRLVAPEAYARIGDDYASGTFEEDAAERTYRFVLEGRLRPLVITPWIVGGWWPELFNNFGFPDEPPEASIDLRGSWMDWRRAAVFVSVDSAGPVIRGAAFDRARLLLFTRPQFNDGLEFSITRGRGRAAGRFTRLFNLDAGPSSQSVDMDFESSLDLAPAVQMLGKDASILAPYSFSKAPEIKVSGRVEGPAAPGGAHQALHFEAKTDGVFRYYGFPVDGVAFTADLRDDVVVLPRISAGFAGGEASGKARVWGVGGDRRLSFDGSLANADLDRLISAMAAYSAAHSPRGAPSPASFLRDRSGLRLDAAASAEGLLDNPLSYRGSGSARLQGAQLGQVRVLGLLSELLRFTSLRFTSARAAFKIEGSRLDFPDVSVTGANSAIAAHGSYQVDRHELDFRARISPFRQSRALPEKFIDAVLAPVSDVLEVRLTGRIDKPSWAFVNGPSNLIRNLTQPPASPAPSPLRQP